MTETRCISSRIDINRVHFSCILPRTKSSGAGSILTPYYFRHNYASILYRSGVDVLTALRYLGHTDPTTTMRIYTHLAEETELKDAEKVRRAFR